MTKKLFQNPLSRPKPGWGLETTSKRLLLAALALVALPYVVTGSESADDRAIFLIFNGREFPGAENEMPFYPGRPNVLEFRLGWHRIAADKVTVRVKKTMPDGREDVLTADVARGSKAFFTLGSLAAPPVYLYEAGEVLYRGYRIDFEVVDGESGATIDSQPFYQGLAKDGITPERLFGHKQARIRNYNINYMPTAMSPERLIAGEMPRQVFNPVYGIEPALVMKLAPKVLEDPDALEVLGRLTPGVTPKLYHEPLSCRIVARDSSGATRFEKELELETPGTWTTTPIDPHGWPEGDRVYGATGRHSRISGVSRKRTPCGSVLSRRGRSSVTRAGRPSRSATSRPRR
jgi:hypothetical protein